MERLQVLIDLSTVGRGIYLFVVDTMKTSSGELPWIISDNAWRGHDSHGWLALVYPQVTLLQSFPSPTISLFPPVAFLSPLWLHFLPAFSFVIQLFPDFRSLFLPSRVLHLSLPYEEIQGIAWENFSKYGIIRVRPKVLWTAWVGY